MNEDIIFTDPQAITKDTIIGGNVDIDKYIMCIKNTQIRVVRPLLGTDLYTKIVNDLDNETLTGLYLELYNSYLKPITKYESCSDYVAISPYTLNNGGLYKNSPDNVEVVSKKEVDALSERYSSIAQTYINDFNRWIELNKTNIPEYNFTQTGIKPISVNINNNWYFD